MQNLNGSWTIDQSHSDIHFKVRHLVISTVTGLFNDFEAKMLVSGDDFTTAQITFSADTDSISTGNKDRDNHLKTDDFFNSEKYPKITFKSKKITSLGENNYSMVGDFTIRDVTKEIALDVEFGGTIVDPYGNTKAGFTLEGKINRKEFGLKWGAVTETGGVVVSDEVRLTLAAEMQKEK